jgi:hypothetical protein
MGDTAKLPGLTAFSLYEPAVCRSFIERASQSDGWIDARVHGNPLDPLDPSQVRREVRRAAVLPLWKAPEIASAFDESLRQTVIPMVSQLWRVRLPQYADAQIVRYAPGGQYVPHQDRGPGTQERYFTLLCYLNDDFLGGATGFPGFGHSEPPQCGKAILFPSEYWHCAEPVRDGCKWVIVAWLIGPAPIRWI